MGERVSPRNAPRQRPTWSLMPLWAVQKQSARTLRLRKVFVLVKTPHLDTCSITTPSDYERWSFKWRILSSNEAFLINNGVFESVTFGMVWDWLLPEACVATRPARRGCDGVRAPGCAVETVLRCPQTFHRGLVSLQTNLVSIAQNESTF